MSDPRRPSRIRRALVPALGGLLVAIVVAFLTEGGGGADATGGLVITITTTIMAGVPACAYLLAALGYGRLLAPISGSSRTVAFGLGLTLLLTISHLLGLLGVWSSGAGFVVALVVVVVGLALAFGGLRRMILGGARVRPPSPLLLLVTPSIGVLLVAACTTAGWLWDSEARGYDVLSYHLQLPAEWLEMGRIEPLEHNVYSYLPGYVEAAFLHLAVMLKAQPGEHAFLTDSSVRIYAAQFLHALCVLTTALCVGSLVRRIGARMGAEEGHARTASILSGLLVVATPWTVVVGSLAYNELVVTTLFACALIAAIDRDLTPIRKGLATGVLVGGACCAKPTALVLVAPSVALVLAIDNPARSYARLALAGGLAGVVTLAPWLVRNWAHAGNPVFPYLAGVFGPGHWSDAQLAAYAQGHAFDGSIADRLRLMVVPEPPAPQLGTTQPHHRGLAHPQWGLFFPVVLLAFIGSLVARASRRWGLLLGGCVALQLVAWLALTHIQSRFLIPTLIPGAAIVGVALCAIGVSARARLAGLVAASLVVFAQSVQTVRIFIGQHQSNPTFALGWDAPLFTGDGLEGDALLESADRYLNQVVPDDGGVLLIGDATPFYIERETHYATTWDRTLLSELVREHPGDTGAWADALRDRGVRYVIANFSEIRRLSAAGWWDKALDQETVKRFLEEECELLWKWRDRDDPERYLVRLRDGEDR